MKKSHSRKLSLNRESLHRLSEGELRPVAGAATVPCPYTLDVVACYSYKINTCYSCTV